MWCPVGRIRIAAALLVLGLVTGGVAVVAQTKEPAKPAPAAKENKAAKTPAREVATQAAGAAAATAAGHPAVPDTVHLTLLIQNTMAAVSQANTTGNYSVLHELAAPSFQHANPPQKLGQIFAGLRGSGVDVTPVILFQPVLSVAPTVNGDGMLHLSGYYDTAPRNVVFEMLFTMVGAKWRLYGIAVNTREAAPRTAQRP
ncbi:MAG: hypothetical protein ACOYLQ_13050 [Hyphomicrobiaceae bacterium]